MPKSLKQQTPQRPQEGNCLLYSLSRLPMVLNKRVHFQGDESLSDRIDRLTDVLYRMDMDGKPNKKPYKPYIVNPRRQGRGSFFRQRGGHSGSDRGEGWPRSKGRFRGGRGGFSRRGRFQGRK